MLPLYTPELGLNGWRVGVGGGGGKGEEEMATGNWESMVEVCEWAT